jgi:sialic acid synthase SpsE
LFVVEDMKAGEIFSTENVRSIRPGHGLQTKYIREIVGKRSLCDIDKGTPLRRDMIAG